MRTFSRLLILITLAASGALSGCTAQIIPNTDVVDTPDNRRIVAFCEIYRKSVERRDIAGLLSLASPHYYEDGGNVDASDDIDYAGLKHYLINKFGQAKGIRYEIRYRRVTVGESQAFVDYTYSGSFRVATTAGEKWRSTVEENRLELVTDGESYKIVAGM